MIFLYTRDRTVLGAVIDKDLTKLRSLLEKGGNPNESSIANNALQEAVNQHNYDMVCLLLDYGADPTYRDPGSNSTPLHEAVSNMYFQRTSEDISNKICIALIQHGAFVNVHRLGYDHRQTPKDLYCTNKDPLFVIAEAGGIRSGWVNEIQPALVH
ncbi:ankyrin repeat domain-containing protein [Candidatus Cardinium hertigii]|uniref:ankyrin repeat domain-containing protein n=1 Tax=Candidatus Cardinium hertigii TaxID=247481 RepID=UPI003D7C860B